MDIIQQPLWGYKRCGVCGVEKPTTDFLKHPKKPDGLQYDCRECHNTRGKTWYAKHREQRAAWYAEHRDERVRYQKKYNEENGGNTQKRIRRKDERYFASRQVRNARRRARAMAGGKYTIDEWVALKEKYNHRCLCCGKQEPEIKLQPDHVIPLAIGGSNTIDNIQPLCKTCNLSKFVKHLDFRT